MGGITLAVGRGIVLAGGRGIIIVRGRGITLAGWGIAFISVGRVGGIGTHEVKWGWRRRWRGWRGWWGGRWGWRRGREGQSKAVLLVMLAELSMAGCVN